ncbi:MAG: hypothetical protein ACI9SC_001433 [Gammaproteobacteria bacterium]|jgi:hypothetical protein
MISFTEILTASDADLVKIFYKINPDPNDDFIIRINKIATQLELNHTQLVCSLGFNLHIRDLSDIFSTLGFRSYKLLSYRCNELFSTDTYNQLPIDNILDIYSERLEDDEILDSLRRILPTRLENIEASLDKEEDAGHIFSYRMEVQSIYTAAVVGQEFASMRLEKNISKFRQISGEIDVCIDLGFFPPSNLFFQDDLSPEEKVLLIENGHITPDMVKNRLQNKDISAEERDMLEDHL